MIDIGYNHENTHFSFTTIWKNGRCPILDKMIIKMINLFIKEQKIYWEDERSNSRKYIFISIYNLFIKILKYTIGC